MTETMARDIPVPRSYSAAVSDPVYGEDWKAAFKSEIDSFHEHKVWRLVDLPAGRKPIRTRWVLKVKENEDGTVSKFKARLVARGFLQVPGIDFTLTYAPVARLTSVRIIFTIAAANKMLIHQMDVSTAFLYAPLQEDVFVIPPDGYCDSVPQGKAYKLDKAMYGLSQSPRAWNIKLDEFMKKELGMVPTSFDPCIYTRTDGLIIAIFVDDALLCHALQTVIDEAKLTLTKHFKMSDLGSVQWYLGMKVERSRSGITLGQSTYITKILERFGMQDCKPQSTPIAQTSLENLHPASEHEQQTKHPFREVVGALMYLSICTRPDIAVVVNKLGRLVSQPTDRHWSVAKGVLRYLQGTKELSLLYRRDEDLTLNVFVDASHADCPRTRRSTSGHLSFLGKSLVDWAVSLSSVVPHSTAESELYAADAAARNTVWLRGLLTDLGITQDGPTVLMEDNEACIKIAEGGGAFGTKKHIAIRFFYVRDLVSDEIIKFKKIATEFQYADALTKCLARPRFLQLRSHLGFHGG